MLPPPLFQDGIHLLSAGVAPWVRKVPEECQGIKLLGTAGSLEEFKDIIGKGVMPSPYDVLVTS